MKRNILISFCLLYLIWGFAAIATVEAENFNLQYEEIFDDTEAQIIVRYGDVDNMGFGWPVGFDPFSGESTPIHSYPWESDPNDAIGTDRIMVISSYVGSPPNGQDGYTTTTSRPQNEPSEIVIQFSPPDPPVNSAILQIFVDDFQSSIWHSNFQVTMNDLRIQELETILNSLNQTGPIGKLITFQLPERVIASMQSNKLSIFVDDPTTGAGDGFAFDFFRLLINPRQLQKTGTIQGHVFNSETDQPISGAKVSSGGVVEVVTDADGYYELKDVPVGLAALTASCLGYESKTFTIDLLINQSATLDFSLYPNINNVSFADAVVSYTPGSGVISPYNLPIKALGKPDYDKSNEDGYVSLGDEGVLILQFIDNSLTTSGDSSTDLWIYEIGNKIEPTSVAISTNGIDWIDVGASSGATSGIDIDAYLDSGVVIGEKYSFVKLTDLLPTQSQSPWAGADIDAVAAISSDDGVPGNLVVSGTITDENGNPLSGISISLSGSDSASVTTDADGYYSFQNLFPGYYKVSPETGTYYPRYEDGTSFRWVELVNKDQGVSEVNFTQDQTQPYVKLLFPRSGDKLSGDFGLFGTAFIDGDCAGCKEINRVEILLNDNEKYYSNFYGSTSDRFSLSQIVWKDIDSNQTIPQTWEDILGTSGYVSMQVRARNQDGVWGYSEKVNIAKADTAATVTISHPDFQAPFPAGGASKTLGYQVSGATPSSAAVWYVFRRVTTPCDLDNAEYVEYDARVSTGSSIQECYPLDDVYPVCAAVRDTDGNTLVDIENIIAYTAARKGHPELNNSGSAMAAFGVNVVSGNLYYQTTDMSLEGVGLPFVLWRRYNSLSHDEESWMGKGGWGHSCDYTIFMGKSGRRLYLAMPDGHWERYALIDGVWQTMTPGAFGVVVANEDNTFTVWDKGMARYDFSHISENRFKPTAITDRNGNRISLSYSSDKLSTITDTRGRSITFIYNLNGYVESVSDGTGRSVIYQYDGGQRLRYFTDRTGNDWGYVHENIDGKWLLTRIADPLGNMLLTNTYDTDGRVVTQTDALGNTWQITYNSDTLTTVTSPLSKATLYTIDAQTKMVTSVKNALSEESSRNYKSSVVKNAIQDVSLVEEAVAPIHQGTGKMITFEYGNVGTGNPTRITDPAGRETILTWIEERTGTNKNLPDTLKPPGTTGNFDFDYDANGNMATLTNPLGKATVFTHNDKGQNLSSTNARQYATTRTYTGNYLTRVTDPKGNYIEYTYDARGRTATVRDKRGNTSTITYNNDDRITGIVDPDGNSVVNTYDASGNLISAQDKRGNTITYTYNAANLMSTRQVTVGGQSHTTTYYYDGLQRVWKIKNARELYSQTAFDDAGRISKSYNPLNEYVQYTYNANGNVTKIEHRDAAGAAVKTVSYAYDDLDRVTQESVALGASTLSTTYTYNAKGLVETVTDPRTKTTTLLYDDLGRLTTVTDANSKTSSAQYDAVGNITKVIDPLGHETTYGYDELNRLITKKDHSLNTWTYGYDQNGNLTSAADPGNKTTAYTYDKLSRVSRVTYSDASTVDYTYDANGNLLTMTDSLGTATHAYDELNRLASRTDCFGKTASYTYDEVGNITGIGYPGGNTVAYSYDEADRMKTVTDWLSHATTYGYNALGQIVSVLNGNTTKVDVSYDAAGRLTGYSNKKSSDSVIAGYSFTLDANGNRTSATITEPLAPSVSDSAQTFVYDVLNRLTSGPNGSFSYDANGNLIQETRSGTTIAYGYDEDDRLVSWSNGTDSYQYKYNGAKELAASVKNGSESRYVFDANKSLPDILARTNSSGLIQDYFIYGASGLISRITSGGVDYTYHFDPAGNTVALTDASQNMVNKYAYTPYGKVTKEETVDNPFEFVGRYGVIAEDNGLNYMRARFYHPDIKRFTSLDTLWGDVNNPQSLNLYAYVEGNPVGRVDPSGHDILKLYDEEYMEHQGHIADELLSMSSGGKDFLAKGWKSWWSFVGENAPEAIASSAVGAVTGGPGGAMAGFWSVAAMDIAHEGVNTFMPAKYRGGTHSLIDTASALSGVKSAGGLLKNGNRVAAVVSALLASKSGYSALKNNRTNQEDEIHQIIKKVKRPAKGALGLRKTINSNASAWKRFMRPIDGTMMPAGTNMTTVGIKN